MSILRIGTGIALCILPIYAKSAVREYDLVRLTAHPQDEKFGETVIEIIQKATPEIFRNLGTVQEVDIHVVIAQNEDEFYKITGGQIPDWGVAAADPRHGVIFLKSQRFNRSDVNVEIIVIHELCHVILGRLVKPGALPRWFDEGFALYHSGELTWESNILLARGLVSGQIIPLEEIDDVLYFKMPKAALAYRESLAAIEYLTEIYGRDVLPRIILSMKSGKTLSQTFISVIGISIAAFEEQWIQHMRQKYLWYAVLDTRLIFSLVIVILFFWALIRKSSESRQQRAVWKEEADYESVCK